MGKLCLGEVNRRREDTAAVSEARKENLLVVRWD